MDPLSLTHNSCSQLREGNEYDLSEEEEDLSLQNDYTVDNKEWVDATISEGESSNASKNVEMNENNLVEGNDIKKYGIDSNYNNLRKNQQNDENKEYNCMNEDWSEQNDENNENSIENEDDEWIDTEKSVDSSEDSEYENKSEDEFEIENSTEDENASANEYNCTDTDIESSCDANWKLIEMKIERLLDESENLGGNENLSEDYDIENEIGKEREIGKNNEKKNKAKYCKTQWVYIQEVQICQEIWKKVYNTDIKTIDRAMYKKYKNRIAKDYIDPIVGCIALVKDWYIGSKQIYQGNETLNIWMYCQHRPCHRKYKLSCNLRDADAAVFQLYRSDNNQTHTKFLTRHVRQVDRDDSKQELLIKMPMELRRENIENADEDMMEQHNLQDVKSDSVYNKMRNEALESIDLDKDDFKDLDKMREENDFIQDLRKEPFAVYIFSKIQCDVIKELDNRSPLDEERVGHLDATGGVIRDLYEGLKRIFYYACVMNLKINEDPVGTLIPIFELVSDCQDASFLAKWIFAFKMYFVARHPKIRTIFHRIVVDKSYALIHAVLESFNNIDINDYLLISYEFVSDNVSKDNVQFKKITKIHICYTHTSKTFSKNILKTFAMKKHTDDTRLLFKVLQFIAKSKSYMEMKYAFYHLATLFLSEFENEEVRKSEKILEDLIENQNEKHNNSNKNDEVYEDDDDEEDADNEKDEKKKNVMYANSPFYHDFEKIIEERSKIFFLTNAEKKTLLKSKQKKSLFYDKNFLRTFAKNYMSILPLWSGLLITDPNVIVYHNQHVESNFNICKGNYRRKSVQLGKLPTKCGRFLRENFKRTLSDVKGFKWNIGKYRLASSYRKKAARTQPKKKPKNKIKKNNERRINSRNKKTTDTQRKRNRSDDEDYVNFADAKEDWGKGGQKRKNGRNNYKIAKKTRKDEDIEHVEGAVGNEFNDYNNFLSFGAAEEYFKVEFVESQLKRRNSKKYLPKRTSQGKIDVADRLENGLIKDSRYYKLVKNFDYVVSVSGRFKLCSTDFSYLSNNQWFSNTLMEYLLKMLLNESKNVEGSCIEADVLFLKPKLDNFYKPFQKRFVLLPLCNKNHFVLFILDIQHRLISYIDPFGEKADDFAAYIKNFKLFLNNYNTKFKSIGKITEWKVQFYEHCLQNDGCNCGPYVLRFCELFILKEDIYIEEFNSYHYRDALKNMVTERSDPDMMRKCLLCGKNENCGKENKHLIKCCMCNRWLHIGSCAKVTIDYSENTSFRCPLCKLNSNGL